MNWKIFTENIVEKSSANYFISTLLLAAATFLLHMQPVFANNTKLQAEAYEFVIPPQFDFVFDFSNGLAAVEIGGKWGFIDKSGKIVLQAIYESTHLAFSEDLIGVSVGDGTNSLWGFIDKQGQMIIRPQFDDVGPFKEGLAAFRVGGGKNGWDAKGNPIGRMGYIDKEGKVVIHPKFHRTYEFSEGLAVFHEKKSAGGKYGYVDRNGKIVISPIFQSADSFKEGLAATSLGDNFGYINKGGSVVIPRKFQSAGSFTAGMAAVTEAKSENIFLGPAGYINKKGTYIIKPLDFPYGGEFHEGRAVITNEENLKGVINRTGQVVVDYALEEISDYANGYAGVRWKEFDDGSYGLMDKNGTLVITPQFSRIGKVSDDLVRVEVDVRGSKKWGFISLKSFPK